MYFTIQWFSDCFWGQYWPQSQCEKGSFFLFFPISWGKIPNSMVIKLFVKIVHESFFKWTFSHLWPGYLFVWLCKQNTTCKIPGTSAVFWVAWFIAYRTAIKLQKHEIGNYSIWNKFYIKDVYWNKNSKYVLWFTLLDILSIQWELKTVDEAEYMNYCQLRFKVKNENVTMLHNSK